MITVAKKLRGNARGQASVETALMLPFLMFLLYYTINAYHTMHTGHIGQKYSAMNMYQRLDNRAKFVVDDVENRVFDKSFIAVQYTDTDGNLPKRRILLISPNPPQINNAVGICREPACN